MTTLISSQLTNQKKYRLLCLQITSLFDGYGGIEYYLHDFLGLATQLYGKEQVVTFIPMRTKTSISEQENIPYQIHPAKFSDHGALARLQNRVPIPLLKLASQVGKSFRPDLILCGHISLGWAAFTLSKLLHVPYATFAYGIESWGGGYPQDVWCLRHAQGIISISDWTKQILVGHGISSDKIKVVHPRLSVEFEKITLKPKTPQNPFTLLTVSRLDSKEQYKGQDHVLLALAKLRSSHPELRLRYIIQGDGSDRRRLEKLAQDLSLTSITEFQNAVKGREALKEVFSKADVFIMPSRFGKSHGRWKGEGFGIVYIEAAAAGLPSIAYRCGGVTDIVTHNINGILVSPDKIDELAEAIYKVSTDNVFFQSLRQNAYRSVMERFTSTPISKELSACMDAFMLVR